MSANITPRELAGRQAKPVFGSHAAPRAAGGVSRAPYGGLGGRRRRSKRPWRARRRARAAGDVGAAKEGQADGEQQGLARERVQHRDFGAQQLDAPAGQWRRRCTRYRRRAGSRSRLPRRHRITPRPARSSEDVERIEPAGQGFKSFAVYSSGVDAGSGCRGRFEASGRAAAARAADLVAFTGRSGLEEGRRGAHLAVVGAQNAGRLRRPGLGGRSGPANRRAARRAARLPRSLPPEGDRRAGARHGGDRRSAADPHDKASAARDRRGCDRCCEADRPVDPGRLDSGRIGGLPGSDRSGNGRFVADRSGGDRSGSGLRAGGRRDDSRSGGSRSAGCPDGSRAAPSTASAGCSCGCCCCNVSAASAASRTLSSSKSMS